MKRTLALLAALALLGACSSAAEDPESSAPVAEAEGKTTKTDGYPRPPDVKGPKRPKSDRPDAKKKRTTDGKRNAAGEVAVTDESPDPDDPTSTEPGGGRGDRKAARQQPSARPSASGIAEPKSGRYTYAQSGWEEFCAGTCNRQQLPATQDTDQKVHERGDGVLQVVTTVRSGQNRSVRSTSLLTRSAMDITKVELTYGSFSESYEPAPPVTSLQLPLRVGDAWSGSWKANTSGDYRFEVLGAETLVVDGRRIKTFKLDTRSNFRGDFRGYATATTWIDPRTVTPIKTSGKIRLTTDFGRFNSNFDQMLLEGPGY